jgi:hypothetical protein
MVAEEPVGDGAAAGAGDAGVAGQVFDVGRSRDLHLGAERGEKLGIARPQALAPAKAIGRLPSQNTLTAALTWVMLPPSIP